MEYYVTSGLVRSTQDGDMHHISENRVIELFGVRRSSVVSRSRLIPGHPYIVLFPKTNGDYSIPAPSIFLGIINNVEQWAPAQYLVQGTYIESDDKFTYHTGKECAKLLGLNPEHCVFDVRDTVKGNYYIKAGIDGETHWEAKRLIDKVVTGTCRHDVNLILE